MVQTHGSVNILLLSMSDLKELLDMKDVLMAVEEAFKLAGLGKVQNPPKMFLFFEKYNGDLRCMPSYIEDLELAAVKMVNVHSRNPKMHGMRSIMATILLIDPVTGAPYAIMDGTHITDMRTGAASAIASKYLARKDSSKLGIIGAGSQGRKQLWAILEIYNELEAVNIYDLNPEASRALVEEAKEQHGDRIKSLAAVDDPEEAVRGMDIIVTCTPSRDPIVKNSWVEKGQHLNCIGADAPGKHEVEPEIMSRAKIFIDDWVQASHSGEINVAVSQGIISKNDIHVSIGDVVAGNSPGRQSDDEITLFCSTGLAVQDAMTARLAYNSAKKKGLGNDFRML